MIAHRGESYLAPENTLGAIELAWALGASAVEFDLRLTADDRLILSHDATTRRRADRTWVIREEPLERLVGVEVGRWKSEQWAGQYMPTPEQVLETVPGGRRIFIEIKDGPEAVGPLVEMLTKTSAVELGQCVVISFNESVIGQVKQDLPDVEACWLVNPSREADPLASQATAKAEKSTISVDQIITTAQSVNSDGLDLKATDKLDAPTIRAVHEANLRAYAWTVDDPAHGRALFQARIDDLTTNRPAWLKAQLAAHEGND